VSAAREKSAGSRVQRESREQEKREEVLMRGGEERVCRSLMPLEQVREAERVQRGAECERGERW